ncbi:MAG: ankyrin repeat domain-containing protein [Acidobacteriota bacterium]
MKTQTLKSQLKSSVLEVGALTLGLLLFGHYQGVVYGHPAVTPLEAIQKGDSGTLRALLDQGVNPNTKDEAGTPLLMQAVLYADAEMIGVLLSRGADPNTTNAAGATALIWAAGDPQKATLLIKAGANVNARSVLGRTALQTASATDGAGDVVRQLLVKGADTKVHDELKGNPKLMTGGGSAPVIVEAAKARDGHALRLLLSAPDVDVNAKDANGGTALTEALVQGNRENVRRLLAAGASVNQSVSYGRFTPLILAAMRGDALEIALMIDAGADVNAPDAAGNTPLMWAAYAADSGPSVAVDYLLRAGADVSAANRKGETALTMARWHGKTRAVQQLMRSTSGGE